MSDSDVQCCFLFDSYFKRSPASSFPKTLLLWDPEYCCRKCRIADPAGLGLLLSKSQLSLQKLKKNKGALVQLHIQKMGLMQ